jgi:hypothetical protein
MSSPEISTEEQLSSSHFKVIVFLDNPVRMSAVANLMASNFGKQALLLYKN